MVQGGPNMGEGQAGGSQVNKVLSDYVGTPYK